MRVRALLRRSRLQPGSHHKRHSPFLLEQSYQIDPNPLRRFNAASSYSIRAGESPGSKDRDASTRADSSSPRDGDRPSLSPRSQAEIPFGSRACISHDTATPAVRRLTQPPWPMPSTRRHDLGAIGDFVEISICVPSGQYESHCCKYCHKGQGAIVVSLRHLKQAMRKDRIERKHPQ